MDNVTEQTKVQNASVNMQSKLSRVKMKVMCLTSGGLAGAETHSNNELQEVSRGHSTT